MNWMQKVLVKISPMSPEAEEEKTEAFEERRRRRLLEVSASIDARVEVPDADTLNDWLGIGGRDEEEGADGDPPGGGKG